METSDVVFAAHDVDDTSRAMFLHHQTWLVHTGSVGLKRTFSLCTADIIIMFESLYCLDLIKLVSIIKFMWEPVCEGRGVGT